MPRTRKKKILVKEPVIVVEEKDDFRDHIDSTKVSAHLFCSICQEVFNNPYRAPCGHSYCKDCISKWLKNSKTCPEDRKQILEKDLHKDFILENIIGDQKVACPFRNYGCSMVCILSTLPSHFKTCPFNTNNLPKFLKDSMDTYLSSQTSPSQNQSKLGSSSDLQEEGDPSPLKYIPLKMRMYMQGGATRDNLVNAFSNDDSEYTRLLKLFKSDE